MEQFDDEVSCGLLQPNASHYLIGQEPSPSTCTSLLRLILSDREGATATLLARHVRTRKSSVLRRLVAMEAEGLFTSEYVLRKQGRPERLFRLTDKGFRVAYAFWPDSAEGVE